jgi:hypothetical protein
MDQEILSFLLWCAMCRSYALSRWAQVAACVAMRKGLVKLAFVTWLLCWSPLNFLEYLPPPTVPLPPFPYEMYGHWCFAWWDHVTSAVRTWARVLPSRELDWMGYFCPSPWGHFFFWSLGLFEEQDWTADAGDLTEGAYMAWCWEVQLYYPCWYVVRVGDLAIMATCV